MRSREHLKRYPLDLYLGPTIPPTGPCWLWPSDDDDDGDGSNDSMSFAKKLEIRVKGN